MHPPKRTRRNPRRNRLLVSSDDAGKKDIPKHDTRIAKLTRMKHNSPHQSLPATAYSGRRFGRRGDPRMTKALDTKLANPEMDSIAALRAGGYEYSLKAPDDTLDSDGITLSQRRNQLARRLRHERTKRGREMTQGKRKKREREPNRAKDKSKRARRRGKARSASPSPQSLPPEISGDYNEDLAFCPLSEGEVDISSDISDLSDIERDPVVGKTMFDQSKAAFPDNTTSSARGHVSSATCPSDTTPLTKPDHDGDHDGDDDDTNTVLGENLLEEDMFGLTEQEKADAHADVRGLRRLDSTIEQGILSKIFGTREADLATESGSKSAIDSNVGTFSRGKTFKSLMPSAIHTLVRQMKVEIEARPIEERQAMLKAFCRCGTMSRGVEFGDERLQLFLRRESMDPAAAARRFVSYWAKRREVFGEDKFYLPLTLDGALRDDRSALEQGHWIILPEADDYGRAIMIWLKRGRYDFKSMCRAIFYISEQVMELPSSRKGVVWLSWDKQTTLWSYDRRLDKFVIDLEDNFLPLVVTAIHVCSVQGALWRLLKPVILATFGRRTRARLRIHLESDGDIADVLHQFGIKRHALPTFMGGHIDVDAVYGAWLRDRGMYNL